MIHKSVSPHFKTYTATLTLIVCALLATGCQVETRIIRSGWDDFAKEMGAESTTQISGDMTSAMLANADQVTNWGIMLDAFGGPDRAIRANNLITQLREKKGLKDFWLKRTNEVAMVMYGSFEDRKSTEARDELYKIRELTIDNKKPYRMAMMQPLAGASKISDDPLDARSYIGFYTMQIGFYDPNFDGDMRQAAENAVKALRADGEDAFYYHGPKRSLVCVGLFTQQDMSQRHSRQGFQVEEYGPRIREVQQKYPNNLMNGVTMVTKYKGKDIGSQPSFLVRIF
ncbi:hypothetical protein JD969_04705 [Planctomycetota bacterium]|nr:hypothetical protein JD969_04705 [Planctomycetota bacterium]